MNHHKLFNIKQKKNVCAGYEKILRSRQERARIIYPPILCTHASALFFRKNKLHRHRKSKNISVNINNGGEDFVGAVAVLFRFRDRFSICGEQCWVSSSVHKMCTNCYNSLRRKKKINTKFENMT